MNVKTESADEFKDSYRDFSLNIENTNWFYIKIFIIKNEKYFENKSITCLI
jgi:hypothetical protein